MATTSTPREGFRSVTPLLMVRDADGLIGFLQRAFRAEVKYREAGDHGLHAELRIGDSMLMVGGAPSLPEKGTASIHMFVDDADAVYALAIAAGAKSLGAVEDRHYGERVGFVEDPFGNYWYIATPLPNASHTRGLRTLNAYLHPASARRQMEFIKEAFGGEEIVFFEREGRVVHAQVRIGDSIVEMGEAEPRPMALYVYVDDPDEVYRKALAERARSLAEPADQPYGERNARVADPFGNLWFPAKTIQG